MRPKLTFVNIEVPTPSAAQRRLVRSRATTASHENPTRKPKTRPTARHGSRHSTTRLGTREHKDITNDAVVQRCSALFREADRSAFMGDAAKLQHTSLTTRPGGSGLDPFGAFPAPVKPWYYRILDYYVNVHFSLAVEVVQHSPAEGQAYVNWHMRESMSEPSLFYMQLVNGLTVPVSEGRVAQAVATWLCGQLITALKEAISDSKRALSTATIFTVASIASHEKLIGDTGIAVDMHGRAFMLMLHLRGGIHALGCPRIGRKLLEWAEHVLAGDEHSKASSGVLSAWAPEERRLRYPGYESVAPSVNTSTRAVDLTELEAMDGAELASIERISSERKAEAGVMKTEGSDHA